MKENNRNIKSSLEVVMELASEYKEPNRTEEELDIEILRFMKAKSNMSTTINSTTYYMIDYNILFTSRELRKYCYNF